jgi:hypothetical protein
VQNSHVRTNVPIKTVWFGLVSQLTLLILSTNYKKFQTINKPRGACQEW